MSSREEAQTAVVYPYGRPITTWQIDEYPAHQRSRFWYIGWGTIGFILLVYAIATANFLFAVILLMGAVVTLLSSFRPPGKLDVAVTTAGILVGGGFYAYPSIKRFSLVYNPPEVKLLYLDFEKPWLPLLSIPLEEVDPNRVREALLPFCVEDLERTDESLTDVLRRVYKL
ncbi:MAG TPA: hypothetical protein VJB99_03880 [Patescibacteria group bacterium]|nr:hypothetical protein [Patescibacteria group bacterium]